MHSLISEKRFQVSLLTKLSYSALQCLYLLIVLHRGGGGMEAAGNCSR